MKEENALVIGRFNLPHWGHVELAKRSLTRCERATIAFSVSVSNNKAAAWYKRAEAFDYLFGPELSKRISYTTWTRPDALEGFTNCTAYLGADRHDLAGMLVKYNKVAQACLIGRIGDLSSSRLRRMIDEDRLDDDTLPTKYVNLIKQIRKEERERGYVS